MTGHRPVELTETVGFRAYTRRPERVHRPDGIVAARDTFLAGIDNRPDNPNYPHKTTKINEKQPTIRGKSPTTQTGTEHGLVWPRCLLYDRLAFAHVNGLPDRGG